jgi:uncharacterized protein YwqG
MSIFDIFKGKNQNLKAEIQRHCKNQITMQSASRTGSLRPDSCKIGGKPFLPADFIWPRYTDKNDEISRPLSFFCQLNLSEVAAYDKEHLLPDHGMLSFFYECESFCWGFDPSDKGAAQVFYFENTENCISFDIPADLDPAYTIPELAVSLTAGVSYPMFEEFDIHSGMDCDWEEYDAILSQLGVNTDEDAEGHKILGYADIIQSEMLSECERIVRGLYCGDPQSYENTSDEEAIDIRNRAKEWTLLLQLSTITTEDFEWMFGDCGMLYYYIKKSDLAERRFENSWFSLQCG